MASTFAWFCRIIFVGLSITQSISLAAYPAKYEDHNGWYGLVLLSVPSISPWLFTMRNEGKLRWLFVVWGSYTWIALAPITAITFRLVENKLDKDAFLGPNVLKMILCISPLVLPLLLNTATDCNEYRVLVSKLSLQITLDLFDGIEMLEVLMEESEVDQEIPDSFENAIIVFVCISFLFSPFQLMEIQLEGNVNRRIQDYPAALRIIIQIVCVDAVFLGLRWALYADYGKDASIFIAKNMVDIFCGCLEVWSIVKTSNSVAPVENDLESHSITQTTSR